MSRTWPLRAADTKGDRMAFCKNCGNQLVDGAKFCGVCGTPVEADPQPAADPFAGASEPKAGQTSGFGAAQATADQTYARQNTGYAGVQNPPAPVAAPPSRGVVGRAWDDFSATPNKFKIILKLALLQLVPGVGGLIISGYSFSWGKDIALGRTGAMPSKIIRPGMLDTGLYVYGISLICQIILSVVYFLIGGLFGFMGFGMVVFWWFLQFVISIFLTPFLSLLYMRVGIVGKLKAGSKLGHVWQMYKSPGKMGSLLGLYWGPSILSGILSAIVIIIAIVVVVAIVTGSAIGMGASYASMASSYSYGMGGSYNVLGPLMSFLGSLLTIVPIVAVFAFILFFISTTAQVVWTRALGYWLQDFRPETWPEYQESLAAGETV